MHGYELRNRSIHGRCPVRVLRGGVSSMVHACGALLVSPSEKGTAMQSSRTRLVCLASASVACLLAASAAHADPSKGAEARGSANVGSPLVKYPRAGPSATRKITKPTARSMMFWSWKLKADTRSHNKTSKEKKFAFPGGGVINGRAAFTGPSLTRDVRNVAVAGNTITLTGNRGSTAFGKGTGSSTATTADGKTTYSVSWTVSAGGTLGTPPPKVKWSSRMNGKDPFFITESDLDQMGFLDKPELDLFFPVGISDISFAGEESGFSFDVEFGISGGTLSLFSLLADESGVSLSGPDSQYDVSIYSLASLHEDPAFGAPTVSIGDLASLIANDLSDGVLDSPSFIGFEVHDVAVADILAGDTFFGAASEAWAGDQAVAPTPATMALLGLGGVLVTRRRR